MATYKVLKSAYRTLIPRRLRSLTSDKSHPLHYLCDPIRLALQRRAGHDEVYDETYYAEAIEPAILRSSEIMAESIAREFHPAFLVDVGCGTGELLRALSLHGVRGLGLERSEAGLRLARAKGVEVAPFDLEQPVDQLEVRRADLAISTEVAEHLPASFAATFVDYLCRLADTVVMTAATPGQGGTDHVNEQPNEYWIAKFRGRGFTYDSLRTSRLREEWKAAGVVTFYHANLLIFSRSGTALSAAT